ncbi:MAG: hypothetical protein HOP10_12930 [Chitinophagaceae bacterium]|nr:hypothetical protein [Chitinophagaceae bacterium]
MKKIVLAIMLAHTGCMVKAQNVGIGTPTPLQKLHVKGIARIDAAGVSSGDAVISMYSGSTNDQSYINFYNNFSAISPSAYFGYSAPSDYSMWSNGSTTAYLKSEGLGISNTTPLTKLHITGGQDAGFGATNNGYIMNGTVTGANLVIDNNEIVARNNGLKADMFLQADSGNVILCSNEQGSVGIGVIAGSSIPAGFLLAVDGKIISEEVKVQLSGNWPDYVFDNKYKLRSFDELRRFISANKHLPNIPAAAEVEKNGIELGDMQKRMMEKIEELTLYVLKLEEEIQQLKKQK